MPLTSITIKTNGEKIDIDALNLRIQEKVRQKIDESGDRVQEAAKANAESQGLVADRTYTKTKGNKATSIPPGYGIRNIIIKKKLDKFFVRITYLGKGYFMKFPEFGTATQRAKPFLGPAAYAEEPQFHEELKNAIKEGSR
jgi:HK97 gp10 family phage protein